MAKITYKGNMPITGSRKEMSPRAPSTSDNRSAQAAQWAARPPAPFGHSGSVVNQPVGRLNMATLGQQFTQVTAPKNPPKRSPGVPVPKAKEALKWVGWDGYKMNLGPNRAVYATNGDTSSNLPTARNEPRSPKQLKKLYPGLYGRS